MGTDIHCHAEIKVDREWHHYSEVPIERDYVLFGFLAGIRCDEQAFPVRGLPADLSVVTRLEADRWDCDGHTHSLIDIKEITRTILKFPKMFAKYYGGSKYLFGNGFENFLVNRDEYPQDIEDVRWVFWFDN